MNSLSHPPSILQFAILFYLLSTLPVIFTVPTVTMKVTFEIRKIFEEFDQNDDGNISCSELVDNICKLGTKLSSDEVPSIMLEFDENGDGYMDLEEFVEFIQSCGLDDGDPSGRCGNKKLRNAFDLCDMDKNGLISASELQKAMKFLGIKCGMSECRKMIKKVDEDGDGFVNFQEFKKMVVKLLASMLVKQLIAIALKMLMKMGKLLIIKCQMKWFMI